MADIDVEHEVTDDSDKTSDPDSDDSDYVPSSESEEEDSDLSDFVPIEEEIRDNEEMFRVQQEQEEALLKGESDEKRKYGIDPEGKYYTNPNDLASYEHFCLLHEITKGQRKSKL